MFKFFIFYFLSFFTIFSQSLDSTFVEEFNDNIRNWTLDDKNNVDIFREIKNGKYCIHQLKQSDFFISTIDTKLDFTNDFSIETKIKHISGFENFDFGLVWAHHGLDDYNFFGINTNLRFSIYRNLEIKKAEKISYPYSNQILTGNQWNILKIERKHSVLNFYINEKLVHTILKAQKHISSGFGIGFMTNNYKKIEIDYLKVKGKFKKLNIIKNPNNGHNLENLTDKINSEYHELGPVISPDGNKLYFFRKNHPQNMGGRNQTDDIWFSDRTLENTWTKAKNVGFPLNNRESNFVISVSIDNNSLMITNKYKSDGSFKDIGISLAIKDSLGKWKVPEDVHINDYLNLNKYVSSSVSADKKYLISSIESNDSHGNMDLYVSYKIDDFHYSKPMNLGNVVNTFSNEISPFLAADNKTLYFSSYGHIGFGSADVFVTRRLDETWQNWSVPENLGSEVNSNAWEAYFTLPASGDYAYMVSNKSSLGLSDIYRIKMNEEAKPQATFLVKGKVINKKNLTPLAAKISVFDLETDSIVSEVISDYNNGNFAIILQKGKKYGFGALKDNFYAINENLDLSTISNYSEIEKNLYLVPIEIGQSVRMNNLFFAYDKSELNSDSKSDIIKLVKLLYSYPKMIIEIGGHTDNVGSDAYNNALSQARVNAVKIKLMELGINSKRLIAKGFGKSKPMASNASEIGKATNRRVEFTIISF